MVHGRELIAITPRGSLLTHLRRSCRNVLVAIRSHFSGRRTCSKSATAAVVAHAIHIAIVHHRSVVHVVNARAVNVVHRAVVKEMTAVPVAALIAEAAITEAVVNAAVTADVWSPETGVPEISSAAPAPITGSPQKSDTWRKDPGAGHPVVAVNAVSPVAGSKNVAVTGANWLCVNRQNGWRDGNSHAETGCRCCGWYHEHSKNCQEQTD